jgi:hypothetical protein
MDQNLATKSDVEKVSAEIQKVEVSLRVESKQLQYKVITTLGSLMTALVGIAVAILKIH